MDAPTRQGRGARVVLGDIVPDRHGSGDRRLAGRLRQDAARHPPGRRAIGAFATSTTSLRSPDVASRRGADLLVIGRGSESGLLGRLRANAYAILRESPCPVVTI
jgi:nucleotide-binding universal stress UspA family protein